MVPDMSLSSTALSSLERPAGQHQGAPVASRYPSLCNTEVLDSQVGHRECKEEKDRRLGH